MKFEARPITVEAVEYQPGKEAEVKEVLKAQDIVKCSDGRTDWIATIVNGQIINIHAGYYVFRLDGQVNVMQGEQFKRLFVEQVTKK